MLLAAIDEYCKGTYDFLYVPIDFKVYIAFTFFLSNIAYYGIFNIMNLSSLCRTNAMWDMLSSTSPNLKILSRFTRYID